MEKLLAAVAQTDGFDDDAPAARIKTSASKWPAGVQPVIIVHNPPPDAARKGRKRKRVRPTVVQPAANQTAPPPPPPPLPPPPPPPPPRTQKKTKQEVVEEEEDVCFICLDGGSLVLCDRKGCPKAYHPGCIKRDEAFFSMKAKWTCGWHICSACQKGSYYKCYTCTYSLCKGCIEDSDFSCVRGDKGFCSTCMNVIMLIENKDQASNESVQVDFDDKTSWEYLLKVYWVILKNKISLTMSELLKARKPPKGAIDVEQSSSLHCSMVNGNASTSTRSAKHVELKMPHVRTSSQQNNGSRSKRSKGSRKKDGPQFEKDIVKPIMDKVTDDPSAAKADDEPGTKEAIDRPITEGDQEKPSAAKDTDKPCICHTTDNKNEDRPGVDGTSEWATKELLEIVAYMRNGNVSSMSQFDVHMLVLDYVKRNNLRNPHEKSRIICDERLKNLFGKPCVGHIEMLKLLESHFLGKDVSQSCFIPAGLVADSMEEDGNMHDVPKQAKVRKQRGCNQKEKKPVQNHINNYAAIDVHNINLLYLRFSLMENLLKDPDSFNDKVVGSIVRIRIFSDDGKRELYRLVRVVGIIKTIEPYRIGDKTSDIMLEILNLNKKEVVQICAISNQQFTEDECIRLRQSIKCGLVKPFTVGEVQKKAAELQHVRINDRMEAEILRLNRLQDRASENGNENELREYMDKLQILQSPEERQRRISEVPEIHSDPRVSPYYESEEDSGNRVNSRKGSSVVTKRKRAENMRPSKTGRLQKGKKSASPDKKVGSNRGRWATRSQSRLVEAVVGSSNSEKQMHQNSNNASGGVGADHATQSTGSEILAATDSAAKSPSANHIETENLWHYRDPNGKIQGPFSMMRLRKWNTSGLFPIEMRIWTNHEQYDSVLLTDALNGHFHGASEVSCQPSLVSHDNGTGIVVSEVKDAKTTTTTVNNHREAAPSNHVNVPSENNTGPPREDVTGSSWWPPCWNSMKDTNVDSEDVQAHKMPPLSSCGQKDVVLPSQGSKNNEFNHEGQSSSGLTQNGTTSGKGPQNKCNHEDQDGESSNDKLKPLSVDWSLNDSDPGTDFVPALKLSDSSILAGNIDALDLPSTGLNFEKASDSLDSDKQDGKVDVLDLLSTGPDFVTVSNSSESGKQTGDINVFDLLSISPKAVHPQQSITSGVPIRDSGISEFLDLMPRLNNEDHAGDGTEIKQSAGINFPVPDSGPSWSSASTTAVGSIQLSDVASVWNSDTAFPTSVKPPQCSSENVGTLANDGFQLTHASSSSAASHASNWMSILDEPIDAFGVDSISDLLAEVDAIESQTLPSATSVLKFARELAEDCKDDCFSSIEDFSPCSEPQKIDALSSSGEVQLTSQSSSAPIQALDTFDSIKSSEHQKIDSLSSSGEVQLTSQSSSAPSKPIQALDIFDSMKRSSVNSSASSEGETNALAYDTGLEFHPCAANQDNMFGRNAVESGRGTVQGNINLVTVQGNVNLVLGGGGPSQGMGTLGWGSTNTASAWMEQNMNNSHTMRSLPWDNQHRICYQENSDLSGSGRGRLPWGRHPMVTSNSSNGSGVSNSMVGGTGGYPRANMKGQRVCKFYESGHCKKGAFCDYLHHP